MTKRTGVSHGPTLAELEKELKGLGDCAMVTKGVSYLRNMLDEAEERGRKEGRYIRKSEREKVEREFKEQLAEKDKKIKELEHPEYMRVFWVLKELEDKNRNYSSEVSKEMKKTIGTVNEQIRELVKLGYVRKGKRDKRQFYKTVDIEVPLDVEGLQQQLAQSQKEKEWLAGELHDRLMDLDYQLPLGVSTREGGIYRLLKAAAEATKETK